MGGDGGSSDDELTFPAMATTGRFGIVRWVLIAILVVAIIFNVWVYVDEVRAGRPLLAAVTGVVVGWNVALLSIQTMAKRLRRPLIVEKPTEEEMRAAFLRAMDEHQERARQAGTN